MAVVLLRRPRLLQPQPSPPSYLTAASPTAPSWLRRWLLQPRLFRPHPSTLTIAARTIVASTIRLQRLRLQQLRLLRPPLFTHRRVFSSSAAASSAAPTSAAGFSSASASSSCRNLLRHPPALQLSRTEDCLVGYSLSPSTGQTEDYPSSSSSSWKLFSFTKSPTLMWRRLNWQPQPRQPTSSSCPSLACHSCFSPLPSPPSSVGRRASALSSPAPPPNDFSVEAFEFVFHSFSFPGRGWNFPAVDSGGSRNLYSGVRVI